ncbi:MAG: translational GTPase TypA [Planctomycetaceae bacterium]|jgi:GTP-binding protein|nr:translational GTPase TypA [Planctomycetaceae bacterium]MCE2812682.1 translational GTPase TypA [Planctomycetaceae bacterium]
MRRQDIRNIVIIAHVDHGKTTMVDCLLKQSGQFRDSQLQGERILDSNDLERERGITILSKNIALEYKGIKINLIDTPGHADFGGEVERVVRMADGALVLIDAAEGTMPQTRFVLSKALECGVKPIVVVNKIDRPDARCDEVVEEALMLLVDLGGEHYMDHFDVIYASGRSGYATHDWRVPGESMVPLLDLMIDKIPGPDVEPDAPLQLLVTNLDWSDYVGRIAIGRIQSGTMKKGQLVDIAKDGSVVASQVANLQLFDKLGRVDTENATAGDIVAVIGLENIEIGDTICNRGQVVPLPRLQVDEPTLEMVFGINSSPLAGRDGKYVTTRQLKARLEKELERNVALRVTPVDGSDAFAVRGRGVLHLSVLIETMRREGYEMSVSKPRVVLKRIDGQLHEPFEVLNVEVPTDRVGPIMEMVGNRRGILETMTPRGEYTLLQFSIPARGLIGVRTKMLNATQGTAIIHHRFAGYQPIGPDMARRANGVLISMVPGKAVAYSLFALQERSDLFVSPGDDVYEGMIVGENARDNDLVVNPTKEKKLTNIRSAGNDENIILRPPRQLFLEAALEYVEDDELVEVTPNSIRLRKIFLRESDRRRNTKGSSELVES